MRDKHIGEILAALAPIASSFICTAADSPRAASPAEMAAEATRAAPGTPAAIATSPMEALMQASRLGTPVIVAGSLYLVGEIRAKLA